MEQWFSGHHKRVPDPVRVLLEAGVRQVPVEGVEKLVGLHRPRESAQGIFVEF